jgi:hypothetical protein
MSAFTDRKPCPFCGELIQPDALKCRFCRNFIVPEVEPVNPEDFRRQPAPDQGLYWLVPINRSGWAIAAGYCGLLALFPFIGLPFALFAFFAGIMAREQMKKNPNLGGMGRVVVGWVLGTIGLLENGLLFLMWANIK